MDEDMERIEGVLMLMTVVMTAHLLLMLILIAWRENNEKVELAFDTYRKTIVFVSSKEVRGSKSAE